MGSNPRASSIKNATGLPFDLLGGLEENEDVKTKTRIHNFEAEYIVFKMSYEVSREVPQYWETVRYVQMLMCVFYFLSAKIG